VRKGLPKRCLRSSNERIPLVFRQAGQLRATSVQVWDKDAGSEDDLMGVAEISKLERFPLWPNHCAAQRHASALSRTAARALQRARARTGVRKRA
jgi:hypothetical protein